MIFSVFVFNPLGEKTMTLPSDLPKVSNNFTPVGHKSPINSEDPVATRTKQAKERTTPSPVSGTSAAASLSDKVTENPLSPMRRVPMPPSLGRASPKADYAALERSLFSENILAKHQAKFTLEQFNQEFQGIKCYEKLSEATKQSQLKYFNACEAAGKSLSRCWFDMALVFEQYSGAEKDKALPLSRVCYQKAVLASKCPVDIMDFLKAYTDYQRLNLQTLKELAIAHYLFDEFHKHRQRDLNVAGAQEKVAENLTQDFSIEKRKELADFYRARAAAAGSQSSRQLAGQLLQALSHEKIDLSTSVEAYAKAEADDEKDWKNLVPEDWSS
jgi:hypothetical protein